MKRYQDMALFLLVLAIVTQTLHVIVRAQPADDTTAPAPTALIGDTVPALTGYTEDSVLTTVSLVADGRHTATVVYAFHPACAFCDTVAPEWAAHFAADDPRAAPVRRIAVTREVLGPAATYAQQFNWDIDLLSVSGFAERARRPSWHREPLGSTSLTRMASSDSTPTEPIWNMWTTPLLKSPPCRGRPAVRSPRGERSEVKRLPRSLALPAIFAMSSCDGPQLADLSVIAIDPQSWLSSSRTPLRGASRSDIGTVTFGDPLRAVPVPGGLVAARYDSGVNDGSDLWNGRLVHIPDDGGDPRVLLDFATDLPGAARLPAASLMAPVLLWDGCPDGRIAVFDPVARKLFMVDPARNERAAVTLPWHPEPLGTDARIANMKSRARAETARWSVSEAELTRLATEAAARLAELSAKEKPPGVDLKCAPDRVWIQSFEGSHPLRYGPLWTTVSFHRASSSFSRVVFPSGFTPYRITESLAFDVVADAGGLQRLAPVLVPPFARSTLTPLPPTIPATSPAWPTNRGDLKP